jgi:hypothetical protein
MSTNPPKFDKVISADTVFPITERITLASLGHFIENLLEWTEEEGLDLAQYFPTDFFDWDEFGELGIDYLDIQKPAGQSLRITATFSWPDLELPLIPDMVSVGNPVFTLNILGSSVSVIIGGTVEIEDYELDVTVHLPSFYLEAEMPDTGEREDHSALSLLKRFNADPGGMAPVSPPRLSQLLILAHPRLQRAVFKLALDDLAFGPVSIDTQLELIYQSGGFTGFIWGDFLIDIDDHKKLLLTLSADYDGPGAGWQLEGGLATSGINLVELFDALLHKMGAEGALPEALSDASVELRYVHLSFNTQTRAFTFSCSLDFQHVFGLDNLGEGSEVELNLDLNLTPHQNTETGKTGYDITFGGQVIMRLGQEEATAPPLELAFDLVFDKGSDSRTIVAAYRNLGGGEVHLKDLVKIFGADIGDLDFTIDLKQAYFISTQTKKPKAGSRGGKPNSGKSKFILGLEVAGGLDLSKLPLVGQIVPNASQLTLNFQPFYASGDFKQEDLSQIQAISPGELSLPAKPVHKGLDLTVMLNLGDQPFKLDVPIKTSDLKRSNKSAAIAQTTGTAGARAGAGSGSDSIPAAAPGEDDGTKWIDLNKNFGPVHFQRLGFQYEDKNFWFRIDGALVAAGLSLSLQGLSVGVSLPDLKPSFDLQGLGMDFKKGGFEIGAAFMRIKHPDYDEYAGLATMRFKKLELSAIGSYARINGHSSLFLYAVLNYPIGGPSFFFVTGLAAGFGYNRNLILPPIDQVSTFPLVAMATDSAPPAPDASPAQRRANLTSVLRNLSQAIPPQTGQYFIAVGIKFTSFKLIDSFLLVSVSFGNRTEIGLLGLSTLQVPMAEATSAGVPPLAVAQLAIRGSFLPEEGFVGVEARLTAASFILSQDCHLTGGFAFYSWFGDNEHAGDFVLSLGGYHPLYKVPEHYPSVPRLGVDWRISSLLSVKAEMYFTLTANALMAGGHLRADFHSGDIKAWFDLGADFIISWKPYFYDAHFHISIGAEVSVDVLVGTIRKTFHLGADVHVWGPEFSGTAEIDLSVTTFTISFGSHSTVPAYISWDEFHKSFLPEAEKVVATTVTGGKLREVEGHIVVNPKELEITLETAVPVKQYGYGEDVQPDALVAEVTVNDQQQSLPAIAMRPLEKGHPDQVRSDLEIAISGELNTEDFYFEPILKKMPASLWDAPIPSDGGKPGKPDLNGDNFIEGALSGFVITPKQPPKLGPTQQISREEFRFTTHEVEDGFHFETERDFVPKADLNGEREDDYIKAHILDKEVKAGREDMLEALGFQLETFGLDIDKTMADGFVEMPAVGKFVA